MPINIWLPATEYYKYFKGYLDYTMIEPYGYNATTVQTVTNLTANSSVFNVEWQFEAPKHWSDAQILEA